MRVCKKCKKEKPFEDFYKTNKYVRYTCKKCENERMWKWKVQKGKKLKKKAVELLGGKCSKCGYKKCIEALDFNHLRDKKYEPTKMFQENKPWKIIEIELKKCELLCANCHREYTFEMREYARG